MKRGPGNRGVNLWLRPELRDKVLAYAERGGMSVQDALRELAELGLQMEPTDVLIIGARQRAYDDARRWAQTMMAAKLKELAYEAEASLGLSIFSPKEQA